MNTLFMHGMGARPKEWQLECLREAGLEVFALHINYSLFPTSFDILKKFILENEIAFLVGRSHGGLMGYWLSEEVGLPCLLVNPHLSIRSKKQTMPALSQRACPLCVAVLGTDDQLVDAKRSEEFIEADKPENPNKIVRYKILDGVGHWLDPELFSEMIRFSLAEITHLSKNKK